jgi:hypothetical protein
MGRYYNSGIGKGIGTSPQTSLENQEYENKVKEIENNHNRANDFVNINETNFPFEESVNKYEKYLLDLNHKKGGSKAKFLKEVLGYKLGDGEKLHKAILEGIKNKQPDNVENTNYGVKYTFNTSIKGLDGKYEQANVIVVVQNDNGKVTWRIVTLYPGKKEK